MSFIRRTRLRWALAMVIAMSFVVVAIACSANRLFNGFLCTLVLLALETWLLLRDQRKRALYFLFGFSGGGFVLSLFSAVYAMDLKLGVVVIAPLLNRARDDRRGRGMRREFLYRRKRRLFYAVRAAVCILAIAAFPLLLFRAEWPLRWAFDMSAPGLEALADRVASGERPNGPTLVGLFLIVRTEIEPHSRNVALIVGGDDSGWHGFVRAGSPRAIRRHWARCTIWEIRNSTCVIDGGMRQRTDEVGFEWRVSDLRAVSWTLRGQARAGSGRLVCCDLKN